MARAGVPPSNAWLVGLMQVGGATAWLRGKVLRLSLRSLAEGPVVS
jgi:hypothetical protein